MPNETVIKVENLSKLYRLGELHKQANSFREKITQSFGRLINLQEFRKNNPTPYALSPTPSSPDDSIWALKNVSFEVKRGEILGIIGRNGAGKSTLLKILSRITKPTEGKAWINGRVGSLLEVGTGFHQELTGRENIFLNGAILGMTKAEIKRKFDEIVDFAEIEKFIDTPVKRYSSGMYVRLAFAVAAHLEPEILLVDEVLAVGDASFQKKCLGKMEEVGSQGRTVLFVSHNINAMQQLCTKAIILDKGRLTRFGDTLEIIPHYLNNKGEHLSPGQWFDLTNASRKGSGKAQFARCRFSCTNKVFNYYPYSDGPLEIELEIESNSAMRIPSIAVSIRDQYGNLLVNADTISIGENVILQKGVNTLRIRIERLHLNPGVYQIGLWLADGGRTVLDRVYSACGIRIMDPGSQRLGVTPKNNGYVTCAFVVERET